MSNHALVDVIGGAPPSTHSSLMRAIRGSSGLKKCPDALRSLFLCNPFFPFSPVHGVVILVGLVDAVPSLVVLEMVEVDASLGGESLEDLYFGETSQNLPHFCENQFSDRFD